MPLVRKPPPAAQIPVPDARKISLSLLEGSDDDRWTAARNASEHADGVALLADALVRERVPRVREAIFTALAKIASTESAAVLLPHLRSDDAARRRGALDALRAMPSAAKAHLRRLLEDEDADVRLLACEIARSLSGEEASQVLGTLLKREQHANVCAAAIDVLAETGGAGSLPILADCAARFPDDPFVGFAVKIAIGRIGSR